MFNTLSVNPAYAGNREVFSFTTLYRNQWSGIEGAPQTFTFSSDMMFKNERVGLGFNLMDDRIGVLHSTVINLSYAYKVPVSEMGKLSFGLQAGFNRYSADYANVQHSPTNSTVVDQAFILPFTNTLPNFGLGIYYSTESFYVGIGLPNLLKNNLSGKYESSINLQNLKNTQGRHLFLSVGQVFSLNEKIKVKPSLLLEAVSGAPLELDINTNIWFNDVFAVGASYRTGDAIVTMCELQATPKFRLGYAYDITISGLSNYNNGSHELMLRYEFASKNTKILSPRYF